ncbi:MAG: hypothetical protein WCX73_06010 [Candidatus Pacearchaeota archaeon]
MKNCNVTVLNQNTNKKEIIPFCGYTENDIKKQIEETWKELKVLEIKWTKYNFEHSAQLHNSNTLKPGQGIENLI